MKPSKKSSKKTSAVKVIGIYAVILIVIVASFLPTLLNPPKLFHLAFNEGGASVVGEIARRTTVEQEIPYQAEDGGIAIQFAAYARTNLGNVNVRIVGEDSGFVYANDTMPASQFGDGEFRDYYYAEDRPTEPETLKITVTSNSRSGQALTIWQTAEDKLEGYDLTVNGQAVEHDLCMQRIVISNRANFTWLIFALTLVAALLTMALISFKRVRLENRYLPVALALGLIYMFVMTPLSIPDEHTHYMASFRLSNYLCFQWDEPGLVNHNYMDYHDLVAHYNAGEFYDRFVNEIADPLPEGETAMEPLTAEVGYPPMVLPQAIGLSIGRLLGANFLVTFYLGRFFNLLFFALCLYFAIKTVPRYKLLFFMVGISPMALHQAASFSYDTYINGMAILLIACILRAIDGEGYITLKEILPVAVVGALLAPAKVVYAPLLLLVILIPLRRFPDRKKYFMALGILFLCAAGLVLAFQLKGIVSVSSSGASGPVTNWEGGINYSIKDILERPGECFQVFVNTITTDIFNWFKQSLGKNLSGLTVIVEEWIITVYAALLMLSSFSFKGEKTTTAWERCVYLVTAMLPILALMFVMFLSWTSTFRTTIQGIQGRYLVPLLPLFFMCVNNRLVTIKRPIEKYLIMGGVLSNLYIMYYVFSGTMHS